MSDDDLDQTQSEWDEVMASQEFRNALQEWEEARKRMLADLPILFQTVETPEPETIEI